MTIIYIVLACIVLIGVYILVRKRLVRSGSQPVPDDVSSEEDKTVQGVACKSHVDEEKSAMLEAYPVLQAIPYITPRAGAYPLSLLMVNDGIRTMLLSKLSMIPVGTPSLTLLSLLQDPLSNAREVTSLVSTNPAFSAKVLQTINSAYFNQLEKVTSVGRAITLMGYNNVRSLILEDLLSNSVAAIRDRDREGYTKIWTHSAVVSACAGHIGKWFGLPEYTMSTIGLLHDIGAFFLETIFRPDGNAEGFAGIIREDKQYGINHAVIGAIIAEKWKLPDIIRDAIEYHHSPAFVSPDAIPEAVRKYSPVIYLADLICNVMGFGGVNDEYLPLRTEYNQMLGLSGNLADLVTPSLVRDMEKARATVKSYVAGR